MDNNTKSPEVHSAPVVLAGIKNSSPIENTVVPLWIKDTDDLSMQSVTSDLIREWWQIKQNTNSSCKNKNNSIHNGNRSGQDHEHHHHP